MHDRLPVVNRPPVAEGPLAPRLEVAVPVSVVRLRPGVRVLPEDEDEPGSGNREGASPDRGPKASLSALRVLIVEDEFFVALGIEQALLEIGCSVVGIAPDFGGAVQAVNQGGFDCAILDINLNGEEVYPVVELLLERGVPFLFVTGYAEKDLPERFRTMPRIQKPLDRLRLERWLRATFTDA